MAAKRTTVAIVPVDQVQQHILIIRGQRVIIDVQLARLYGVTTKRLNEQVKRNNDRFPADFMFQLTWKEAAELAHHLADSASGTSPRSRSQIATLNRGSNVKYRRFAFTEHGAIMAANVLNSQEAVKASVFVVRAFVKLREMLVSHMQLATKLDELERKLQDHDGQIVTLIEAIRELMDPPDEPAKPPIGFHTEIKEALPASAKIRRSRNRK